MKIKQMTPEEFWPLMQRNESKVFKGPHYGPQRIMTAHERSGHAHRKKFIKDRIELCYGLFDEKDRFVGWTAGLQVNPLEFYMMNSAIFPKYRRKGWYTRMMKMVLKETQKLGFQLVTSNHHLTNSPVIIAKMRQGFVISGMEVSDAMGALVRLSYFHNPSRAEILKYRTGETRPTARVKRILKLK